MSFSLVDKHIFISGASSGLGAELARQCAKESCHIYLAGRRIEHLEELAKELGSDSVKASAIQLDLANEDSITAAISRLSTFTKHVDVLINNAGVSQRGTALETDLAVTKRIMAVNFQGTVALTKGLQGHLEQSSSPQIAVISSISGLFGFPLRSAYAASKHALQGYFETMQLESDRPKVTIVSPGPIRTDISLAALDSSGKPHNVMDDLQLKGVSVNHAANQIIRALKKGRRQVLIGKSERILVFVHRYAPWAFHFIVKNSKHA